MAKNRAYLDVEKLQRDSSAASLSSRGGDDDTASVATSQIPLTGQDGEESEGSDEPDRGNWTGKFDFILSLLGYSVGLGNVWRFPYLCYMNGGGAFLIPFVVMLLFAGLPLMFMELALGQYVSLGPIELYRHFCPLLGGLGWGMVIISAVVMLYYNMIIAWTLFYVFVSFTDVLPWEVCNPDWSSQDCYEYQKADPCLAHNGSWFRQVCYFPETPTSGIDPWPPEILATDATGLTAPLPTNLTSQFSFVLESAKNASKIAPSEEYFNNVMLGRSEGIDVTGHPRWALVLCLGLAWVIVFLCLCKGVKTSGKVVYFTALFPYVVLVILFIRGITLPGASDGILFYLTPNFEKLGKAKVWGDAAVQIFFALSPAWGGLITLASYNKFDNNCYRDALIVSISNVLTSFFAGFVIFSIIGFLAAEKGVPVDKVVSQGAGLAFMVYPEVVARLPVAPVWSVLFFFMLLTLGLDSQFALMETVTTAILDAFTSLRERKTLVVLGVSCFGFLGGLIFTTHGGLFWLELLDHYAANYSVLLIATMECVYVAWFYGSRRFLNDIQSMIGRQRREWKIVWTWVWKFLTPATLLFILVFNWIQYEPLKSGSYVFPTWSNVVGWCFSIAPVTAILVIAGVNLYSKGQGPVTNRLWSLFQPGTDWGPAHLRLKKNRSTVLNGFPGGLATIPEFNFSAYEDDDDEGIRMGHSSRDTATAIQAKNLMFLKHQDEPS